MSTKSNPKSVVNTEQQVQKEPVFLIDKLRQNSLHLFGVSTSTFDGALYGHTEKELTVNDCRAIINKWLGKE